jgi:hypothetical protein
MDLIELFNMRGLSRKTDEEMSCSYGTRRFVTFHWNLSFDFVRNYFNSRVRCLIWRLQSSAIWQSVVWQKYTDVSDKHAAAIWRSVKLRWKTTLAPEFIAYYLRHFVISSHSDLVLHFPFGRTSRKVACSIPDEVTRCFNWPNPYSRTMALGSTQFVTEMSTRNLTGGKGRPARKADNITAISEPIV